MAYFSWSVDMRVGNRFIDNSHRNIIDIINKLHDAMRFRNGGDFLKKVLFDLMACTKGHFQREEEHIKGIGFAGVEADKREHKLLLEQVAILRQKARITR